MNLNHVTIAGNLATEPESKFTTGGKQVCQMRLANNFKWGETKKTTFITCVAWGKSAEIAEQYLRKGSPVVIEGRLEQNDWETKQGEKRTTYQIQVSQLHFFPKGATLEGGAEGGNGPAGPGTGGYSGQGQGNQGQANGQGAPGVTEDDIPF